MEDTNFEQAFGLIMVMQIVAVLFGLPTIDVGLFIGWCGFVYVLFNMGTVAAHTSLWYRKAQEWVVAGW